TVNWNFGVVDVDGDGRADLIAYVVGPNGLESYVALATGGGNFGPAIYNAVPGSYTGATVLLADLNGDGRIDLVASIAVPNGWQIYGALGNGNGTFANAASTFTSMGGSGGGILGLPVVAGDLNGDGRTDLFAYADGTLAMQIWLAFSKGDGTFAVQP